MNYYRIYYSIIQKAKSENRIKLRKNQKGYVYYERHHVMPRCLGGSDDVENLVLLTAREHFVCHKLLTYIYKGNRKIALAFHKMTFCKKKKYNTSSRDYAYARELVNSIPFSEETRKKLSKSCKGRISSMKGKHHTQKTKDRMSKKLKGRIVSDSTKQKQREANLGEKNPMFGKPGHFLGTPLSDNQKENLRNLYLGKSLEELYGKEKADKIKQKISVNVSTKLKGHKVSDETRKKISEKARERYKNPLEREKTRKAVIKKLEMERIQGSQMK